MAEKYTLGKDWMDAIFPQRRDQMRQLYESEPETMAKDNVGPSYYEYKSWGVDDKDFFNSFDFEEEGGYPNWLEDYAEQEHGVLSKDWMKEQFFGTDDKTSMQSYFEQEKAFKGTMSYKAKQWGRFISDMLNL